MVLVIEATRVATTATHRVEEDDDTENVERMLNRGDRRILRAHQRSSSVDDQLVLPFCP